MSAIPLLLPKTSGGRPPIDPPSRTTFDSSSSGDKDPWIKVLADSVKELLKRIPDSAPDQLPVMLTLIRMRKKNIANELSCERMLSDDFMPPEIMDMYSLEYLFEETEAVRTYNRLLLTLEEAEHSVESKMRDLNIEAPASDL